MLGSKLSRCDILRAGLRLLLLVSFEGGADVE